MEHAEEENGAAFVLSSKRRPFRQKIRGTRFVRKVRPFGSEEKTFLEVRSVNPPTVSRYTTLLKTLTVWAALCGIMLLAGAMAVVIVEYLEELNFQGESVDTAATLIAAVLWKWPQLRKNLGGLPRADQALRGWRKIQPGRSRLPPPRPLIALVVAELMLMGKWKVAAGVWIAQACYLRPGELLRCLRRDLVSPIKNASSSVADWVLILNPQERGARPRLASSTTQWSSILRTSVVWTRFGAG